jgi:Fe-S-cluster-containing dehydrogenase component/anaerobic selenocysteine-containing dehydrogenase
MNRSERETSTGTTRSESPSTDAVDLEAVRARLESVGAPVTWRSLEELTRTPAEHAGLQREVVATPDGYSRRSFLQLMGASVALAGLAGCTRQPLESVVPYVKQPEEIVPGRPLFFATALTFSGFATGVLVESHMGRPTKIEGNPEHPASLGATDRFGQAAILEMYDPDRSTAVMQLGEISTWSGAADALRVALGEQQTNQGEGIRLLTRTVCSPTLASQIDTFQKQFPSARWVQYEGDARDAVRAGTSMAFGSSLEVRSDLSRADVVLALESDFLTSGVGTLRATHDFMERRRVSEEQTNMNRLYVVESCPTGTGAVADHRLALRPDDIGRFVAALAADLGVPGVERPQLSGDSRAQRWLEAVSADLQRVSGRGLVIAGDTLPAEAHVLVHAINEVLGNAGRTVLYTDPVEARPAAQHDELAELVADMNDGRVDLLICIDCNPVYSAPGDLRFADAMARVKLRFHVGLHADETAELCHWHVPMNHALESWSDARAHDGTEGVQQPLIEPLYDGKSPHDILAVLLGQPDDTGLDLIRRRWRERYPVDFEQRWRRVLHDGLAEGTALAPRNAGVRAGAATDAAAALAAREPSGEGLDVAIRLDPNVHDGRFANNGWLQELPRPLSKITWDNAALVSPGTAASLGVRSGDVVALEGRLGRVELPVWVLPGHADGCLTVHLGYGRRRAGRVGNGVGVDVASLRTAASPWSARVPVRPTGGRHELVSTQEHQDMAHRNVVRTGTIEEYVHHPEFAKEQGEAPARDTTLYPPMLTSNYQWGMTIDLGTCTGCNACVVACNAENNIPVVGKEQVRAGREMQWIRIDRYFEGDPAAPELLHQPVPCMQCENAPCEVVCPVGATSHSPEGLNDMVYNRCVGTRYCSNNCPYKVRRFNFYMFADLETPSLKLMRNPDVTVRTRGVMEKCTYCVQRINHARIESRNEGRDIRDGEIVTACQQVCPAQAIVFGNVADPHSQVSRHKADGRNYGLLEDVNTRPRTTYLARLRNPNPELEA